MAIPVMTFQDPLLTAPNPFLAGLSQGVGIGGKLQQMQLARALAPIQRAYIQAQTSAIPSETALRKAQTEYYGAETKMEPIKTLLAAIQGQRMASRFGPAYQFARLFGSLPSGQKDIYYAHHPAQYKAAMNLLGANIMAAQQPSPLTQLLNTYLRKIFPGYAPEAPTTAPAPTSPAAVTPGVTIGPTLSAAAPGPLNLPAPMTPTAPLTPLSPTAPTTPAVPSAQVPAAMTAPAEIAAPSVPQAPAEAITAPPGTPAAPKTPLQQWQDLPEPPLESNLTPQEQMDMVANRAAAPSKLANDWAVASAVLERTLLMNRRKYAILIKQAAKYAGALGRGKAYADQWANKNPGAVEAYRWYNRIFVPVLANRMNKIEGMGATDQQQATLTRLTNQVKNILSNPQQAIVGVNQVMDIIHQIAIGNYAPAELVHKGLYQKMIGIPWPKGNFLDIDTTPAQTVLMRDTTGKLWHVPIGKVGAALKLGGTRVQ